MEIRLLNEERAYEGATLRGHFAFRNLGILGNSAVAFTGPCEVSLENMVDWEDVRRQSPIYSPRMLHILVELFETSLKTAVCWQRLLVASFAELLRERGLTQLERCGDDLFVDGRKLSVSIATCSPVSALIHFGVNLETQGVPVPAVGLTELGLREISGLAMEFLQRIQAEWRGIERACCKVKPVS